MILGIQLKMYVGVDPRYSAATLEPWIIIDSPVRKQSKLKITANASFTNKVGLLVQLFKC